MTARESKGWQSSYSGLSWTYPWICGQLELTQAAPGWAVSHIWRSFVCKLVRDDLDWDNWTFLIWSLTLQLASPSLFKWWRQSSKKVWKQEGPLKVKTHKQHIVTSASFYQSKQIMRPTQTQWGRIQAPVLEGGAAESWYKWYRYWEETNWGHLYTQSTCHC